MPTTQDITHTSGGENFIEDDSTITKACVIFAKDFIQIQAPIYIPTCVTGGWTKQNAVQKQFLVKMI
jgi:hypothetical protein